MKLNLGCGALIIPGFVNVDIAPGKGVDMVADLDTLWPWPDESVDTIFALDIYEHVDKPLLFVNEMWRVMEPGGIVRLRTTFWKTEQSYTDPTHKRWLTDKSFDYWIPGTEWHARYGNAYSGGRHFSFHENGVWEDGMELEWRLRKEGRCEGACNGSTGKLWFRGIEGHRIESAHD